MVKSRKIYNREAFVESINLGLGEKYISTLADSKIQLFEKENFIISKFGKKIYIRKISFEDNHSHLVVVYTFK